MQLPPISRALALVLTVAACSPLSPRNLIGRGGEETSDVSVSFDPTALGEVAAKMKTLQVRVFKVEEDVTGAQEGDTQRLAIELGANTYTITGVRLGLKEFEIAILDAQDLALGTGKMRMLVKPGKNRAEPLVIKLNQIVQPLVSLPLEIKIAGASAAEVKQVTVEWKTADAASPEVKTVTLTAAATDIAAVNYETDIKPILESNCTDCHQEDFAANELKLDRWPFVSGAIAESATLLSTVMERIQDAVRPMPSDGLMDVALIDKMKAWQAGGFLATAPANGETLYRGAIDDLKVAAMVNCTLVLKGVDGVELHRQELDAHVVQEGGVLAHSMTLTLENPEVEIPVVVEP